MQTSLFLGIVLHAIGAFSAASCYTPQKKTTGWAWEVYWLATASFAWLILPIIGAFLTFPNYLEILSDCDPQIIWKSFGLGVVYGVGGLMFGLGIRYVGFSLNYSIAIGFSAWIGTLCPLLWDPYAGFTPEKITEKFSTTSGLIVLAGIVISLVGIAVCGLAGALRERAGGDSPTRFSFRKGVPIAVAAGVLSAVFNYALIAGKPLGEKAAGNDAVAEALVQGLPADSVQPEGAEETEATASDVLKMNAVFPFSHGGAFLTNLIWCGILIRRNRTGGQFLKLPGKNAGKLGFYYLMALLSGAFWYFQFFFFGMAEYNMGEEFAFVGWALHMAMLILFSNVYGWLFREWDGVGRTPRRVLHAGMAIIVAAVIVIACGKWQGMLEEEAKKKAEGTTAAAVSSTFALFATQSNSLDS